MSHHLTDISSCKWKHGGQDWPLVRKDNDEMEKKENYTHLLWFVHLEWCCHSTQPLPWQRQRGRHVRSRHITTLTSSSPSRHHTRPTRLAAVRGCQDSLKKKSVTLTNWHRDLAKLPVSWNYLFSQSTMYTRTKVLHIIFDTYVQHNKIVCTYMSEGTHILENTVAHPTLNIKIYWC